MIIALFGTTSIKAQTGCKLTTTHTAVKHKSVSHHSAAAGQSASKITACRMVPYQVCTINADRRSVTCYATTDSADQTPTGPGKVYGPTGPMPGKIVNFKVRTIVIKGQNKGAYCKRNKENNATVCYQPGYLVRDENGYYSYGEPATKRTTRSIASK